jgi:hypothetical protein
MATTVPGPVVVAAAVVVLASVVGCTATGSETAAPSARANAARPTATLPPVEAEAGVVHVHGLGVDPADGVLYAATHTGVFRIPDRGAAERVANRAQDTMGFSVVGPGRFIGSGHPDFREDDVRPPLLGLVESDDAGQTWERLSLHGEADFHALAAAHGQVYGYDSTSGTFMVTVDRKQWDRRSRLPMRDFAVDPADSDRIVATTEEGPAISSDGGRTWAPLPGAPPLVVLAWTASAGLYGVAVDGSVHRSVDSGRTWTRTGSAGGRPEAVAVDDRGAAVSLYVAVEGKGIVASFDGGRTFAVRYAE